MHTIMPESSNARIDKTSVGRSRGRKEPVIVRVQEDGMY